MTRLNGPVFALNPDLVERADSTPDTVITLVDGTKYVVGESLAEVVALIRRYRASVVADAQQMVTQPAEARHDAGAHDVPHTGPDAEDPGSTGGTVVPLHRRER
nr:flagellar FlbD family protein [Planosporangium thailandense]